MKTCPKCDTEKELSEFNVSNCRKDGRQSQCRTCKADTQKKWYQKNKTDHKKRCGQIRDQIVAANRQFLWEYLSLHPCVDCGETDPAALQFDHVRDKKRRALSQMKSCSKKTIEKEISKCDVRCASCHAKKTARDQNWYKSVIRAGSSVG